MVTHTTHTTLIHPKQTFIATLLIRIKCRGHTSHLTARRDIPTKLVPRLTMDGKEVLKTSDLEQPHSNRG
jgi:hypothetical protein